VLAYLREGYLHVTDVPNTQEGKDLLDEVAEMLATMYSIGRQQILIDSSGFRSKTRRYELRAMIGHIHPGEASQEEVLGMARKLLSLDES